MASFNIVQGDLAPDLRFVLTVNGAAEDISDALEVFMRWRKPDGTVDEERELEEDVSSGGYAAGAVKCVWEEGDTDQIGTHSAQIVVTRGNGEPQTFPSNGKYLTWKVFASL